MRSALRALSALLPFAAAAQSRPAVTPAEYGKWESSGAATLSPDGRWFAWTITRVDETAELRARRLDRDTLLVFAQGAAPVFSVNGRWLVFTQQPTPAEREKLEREKKPVRSSTVVVDLSTGASTTVGQSTGHRFSADGRFLATRLHPADAAKRDAADLLVRDLAAGTTQVLGNVATWSWSDTGALLAITLDTDGAAGNGVQLLDAAAGRLVTLASSPDRYRGLAWRKGAADLAVLRSQATPAWRDTNHVVLAWRGVSAPGVTPVVLDPVAASSGVPADHRVAESRVPEWTRDGAALLIGLRPREARRDTTPAAPGATKPSDVQVWHVRDVRPIPMQKAQEAQDNRRTLLAVWWPTEQRVIRVGTGLHDVVSVAEQGHVAVEVSMARYPFGQMFGRQRRDVDAIDLRTGQRRRLADSVRYVGTLSPGGRWYSFFSNGSWKVASTSTGAVTTLAVPGATFEDRDTDSPTDEFGPFTGSTWSSDERWLFVGDQYDMYRISVDGRDARRLTSGAASQLVHRLASVEPFEFGRTPAVDVTRPVMLSLVGEWTKESGYARLLPTGAVERLVLTAAAHGRLLKADSATTWAFTRSRFDTSPDWFVGGPTLADARQVSALNAFQKDFAWGRAELVEFRSDSGRRLQGALYYPANYDPSRKYPMIVNTYEILSTQLHQYQAPSERSYYNRTAWTQQGYFVFTPDIVFRWGDPGRSYLECLIPAVKAVIAKGLVDSARIGLVGHSWGGYEAAYAPTQTNLFATSIAGAPITNFLSFAGAFHWSAGMPEFDHWETGQARMVRPPWEDLEGHLRNSPAASIHKLERPMLMMFGDADGTVDWHQGVEFYNFARRAGREGFVMLVYPGEDHGLRRKENQVDYHRRILQWFGHYLKGEPAPEWIRRGVTWQERKAVDGKP